MTGLPVPADIERLLVVCPSWVGDAIMATPTFRAIRAARPDTRIIALARPGPADVLAGVPWIDEVITATDRGLTGPWRVARRVRSARPDAAVLLPNSFRTALTLALARVPRRVGYDRDGRGRLLTHRLSVEPRETPATLLEYYERLITWSFGIDDVPPQMSIVVDEDDRTEARRLLADEDTPLAVLNPGGNDEAKRWPAASFAEVGEALHTRHGMQVAVTGSPGEREVVREIVDAMSAPAVDLVAAGVTLRSLKAVIARATVLVTNDTGPRHIAAAVGTPVVTLFGPTDHRWTTLPGVREHIVLAEPFLPEELVADDHPKVCVIDRITVADTLAAVETLLADRNG
jgi:heptosyltransferase-2